MFDRCALKRRLDQGYADPPLEGRQLQEIAAKNNKRNTAKAMPGLDIQVGAN